GFLAVLAERRSGGWIKKIFQDRGEFAAGAGSRNLFHAFDVHGFVADLDVLVTLASVLVRDVGRHGIQRLPSILGMIAFIARGDLAAEEIRQLAGVLRGSG